VRSWFVIVPLVVAVLAAAPARANLLSSEDQATYRQAFGTFQNDQTQAAQSIAGHAQNKLLAKVLQWYVYSQPNSGALFGDITAFVVANPDWPQAAALIRRAEESISVVTPEPALLAWFDEHPPLTVDGALAYAKALLDSGRQPKAEAVARQAWVTGNFGPQQEQDFLTSLAGLLRNEDQVARLDRLLWERQQVAAAQQLQRVGGDYRPVAEARLALAANASNAEALLAIVPARLRDDPGLVYDQVRYRRQHDEDDKAIELLKRPLRSKVRPDMWWGERSILARRALQRGRVTDAYHIASEHGLSDGASYADAEWLTGWIALRFLDDREGALRHFATMFDRVATAQSRARAAYWAGRACDVLGRGDDAARWYAAAARYVTTFYGQLAAARLNQDPQWLLPADPLPTASEIESFDRQELVKAARMLGEIGQSELARPFLLRLNDLAKTPGEQALAANLATALGRADIAVAVARRAEREGVPLITSGYPIPPLGTPDTPERALVLALIRQESAFHFEAISPVGARGLMQLMPTTAAKVAKSLNVPFKTNDTLSDALIHDPRLNVKLGTAYLGNLLDSFGGSYILSVAAYNAGPARVRQWLHDAGDPRTAGTDAVDWIEGIPFTETRNYVQRVLEGLQVYRRRLGTTALVLSLDGDLKR
jgi:soluble lytic murein transglycosylase